MATIVALISAMIITADCLTGGHLGCKKAILCLMKNRQSRRFTISGIVCAGLLALLLATGGLSIDELIEQERQHVDLCPKCM